MKPLDITKTHWVVIGGSHFTGREWPKERRKTRRGALKAMGSLERFADHDEYFYVRRNDIPNEKYY